LLLLSNAIQNQMNGGDNSRVGGLISALPLVALNYMVGIATSRSKRLDAYIEGRPEVQGHHGGLYPQVLLSAQLTRHELDTAIRAAGCESIQDVHVAILGNTGSITVLPKHSRA
jgi:uncharacterized membrane protein YcaP (DUF421 family)